MKLNNAHEKKNSFHLFNLEPTGSQGPVCMIKNQLKGGTQK